MRLARVRRLPVVDDGKLEGIISLADIITSHARGARHQAGREGNGISATLAIICERPVVRSAPSNDTAPIAAGGPPRGEGLRLLG